MFVHLVFCGVMSFSILQIRLLFDGMIKVFKHCII